MTLPRAAIIIVNWRRYNLTFQLLTTLQRIDCGGCEAVVVVDNESRSLLKLKKLQQHPLSPRVLVNTRNLGFAGAVNQALLDCRERGYDCFFILGNDVKPAEGFFEPMFAAMAHPHIGFISPVTLDAQGVPESCGVDVDPSSPYVVHHRTAIPEEMDWNYVDSVHGAVIGFTAGTLERVGYMDEEYFHTWEETDWCIRAKSVGLKNCIPINARVYHLGCGSLPEEHEYHPVLEYLLMRNMLLFLDKRGYGRECIEAHIDYWRANAQSTSFREHQSSPNPPLAQTVIARAIHDYRVGRTGKWPRELWAKLHGQVPARKGVFSSQDEPSSKSGPG
jgi:GT2 family glycosyltransferase